MSTSFISTTNVFVKKGEEHLVLRRGKDVSVFKDYIMGPGGKQDEGEGVHETAAREMLEETGIDVKNLKLKAVGTHNHYYKNKTYLVFVFVADYDKGEIIDSNEGDLEWHTLEKLLNEDKLWADLKIYLPHIVSDSSNILFSYLKYNQDFEIVESRVNYC
jgi:8-oxo-dGTP pyrophosphatase MutT (NUDIX family)